MKIPSFSETFQAVPGEITFAREFILAGLEKFEVENKTDILIAVGEALQNIVRHAYINTKPGDFLLTITKLGDVIEVVIKDDAPTSNPELFMHQTHSPSESGGMGIGLIKKITIGFKIDPQVDGNITTLQFHV
jgi:anti-sigma regulatory factor (Ser/Thr protein kinase)